MPGAAEATGSTAPRLGAVIGSQERYGTNRTIRKAEENAEVQGPLAQPLQDLRTPARVSAQVRDVPHLFPRLCAEGRNPRCDQGQLVAFEFDRRWEVPK